MNNDDSTGQTYRPRLVDRLIRDELEVIGATVIEGAKWCGKTTTAKRFARSDLSLADPSEMQQYLQLADVSPRTLLEGENPRLIDEWQRAPKLWDVIRNEVDERDLPGLYILTGSTTPPDTKQIFHSGAGRFAWVKMRPMSLLESGESNGGMSLSALFAGEKNLSARGGLRDIRELAFLTCRGGWPKAVSVGGEKSLRLAFAYVDAVVRSDISTVDGVRRDSEKTLKLLRSLARNQASQVSDETILADMGEDGGSMTTVKTYLEALKRIFVTENALAWNPNLRSKTVIRTSDTHYFVDPSIATAALGLGPEDLINDIRTFGLFFETLAVRDLRVYTETLGGNVYHYRDKSGLECDAVIHLRNGKYGLVEIKLGGEELVESGVTVLKDLRDKIDTTRMPEPSFLMVVTGVGEYAYQRNDGVYVVPVGCLGV